MGKHDQRYTQVAALHCVGAEASAAPPHCCFPSLLCAITAVPPHCCTVELPPDPCLLSLAVSRSAYN